MAEFTQHTTSKIQSYLDKLERSQTFAQSGSLARFLRFVVEELVAGREERLNQYTIGFEVMGRDESFDPATDSAVRVEARRLRLKLLEYYDGDGRGDEIRFVLPKGRYAPLVQFQQNEGTTSSASSDRLRADFMSRPAIAVLPFDNMSGDPEQDYFADGLTEDIITGLSAFRWCPVIGRHSTFAYKGIGADLKEISRELGARYIVEGSVRRSGGRIRINAQLIDADQDVHLWAERFDRPATDIFAVQDDITEKVVTNIVPEFRHAEISRSAKIHPNDLGVWELVNRGLWHLNQHNRKAVSAAREQFEKAIALDPTYAVAYAWLSVAIVFAINRGWRSDTEDALGEAYAAAGRAVELNPLDADCRRQLAVCLVYMKRHEEAVEEAREAIRLNPSNVEAHYAMALALCYSGHPVDALKACETSTRLNPQGLYVSVISSTTSLAHLLDGHYQEAVSAARKAIRTDPKSPRGYHRLAIALAHQGDQPDARNALAESQKLLVGPSLEFLETTYPFANRQHFERVLDGLRMAGWEPESDDTQ